jgi:hypothetical protein
MIDLAAGYTRTRELLTQYGLGSAPYTLGVEVWSGAEGPRVVFNVAVTAAPRETFGAFNKPTVEAALAELERMLRSRGPVTDAPTATSDLRVEIPT